MASILPTLTNTIQASMDKSPQTKPGKSEGRTVVTGIGNKPISQAKAPEIVIPSESSPYPPSAKSSARPSVVSLGSNAKRLGMLLLLAPSVFGRSCGPTSPGFDAERKQCTGNTYVDGDCKGLNNATRDLFSAIEAHPSICIDGEYHANVTDWASFTLDSQASVDDFLTNPDRADCLNTQNKNLMLACLNEAKFQFDTFVTFGNATRSPTPAPIPADDVPADDEKPEYDFKFIIGMSMLASVAVYALSFAMHFRLVENKSVKGEVEGSESFVNEEDAGKLQSHATSLLYYDVEDPKSGVHGVQKAYNDSWMKWIDQIARMLNGVMRVSLGLFLPLSINESLKPKPSQSAAVYFLMNLGFHAVLSFFSNRFKDTEKIQQLRNSFTKPFKSEPDYFQYRKNEFRANLYSDSFKGRLSHLTTNQKKELVKLADNQYPFDFDFESKKQLLMPLGADLLFTGILLAFNDDMSSDVTWAVPLTFAVLKLALKAYSQIDHPSVTYLNKVDYELKERHLFDPLPQQEVQDLESGNGGPSSVNQGGGDRSMSVANNLSAAGGVEEKKDNGQEETKGHGNGDGPFGGGSGSDSDGEQLQRRSGRGQQAGLSTDGIKIEHVNRLKTERAEEKGHGTGGGTQRSGNGGAGSASVTPARTVSLDQSPSVVEMTHSTSEVEQYL